MSFAQNARTSIAARQRTRELSGDLRAGAWSRREVRKLQRAWLRKHWRIIAWLALGVTLAVGAIESLAPASTRSYLVGALIASAAWWIHCLMITSGGLAGKLIGIAAETSVATELRLLCRRGWRLVNHVSEIEAEIVRSARTLLEDAGFDGEGWAEWVKSKPRAALMPAKPVVADPIG